MSRQMAALGTDPVLPERAYHRGHLASANELQRTPLDADAVILALGCAFDDGVNVLVRGLRRSRPVFPDRVCGRMGLGRRPHCASLRCSPFPLR